MVVYKALTIAGSDSGGGAGIQADLKTFQELQVFGMSAVTAVTAQNSVGVQGVFPMSPDAVARQIESIGTDLGVDAVKTGMLFSSEIISTVAEQVRRFGWRHLVVDPVMIAKSGASLLREEAVQALQKELLPLAELVTPNIPEAEVLTGITIRTMEDRKEAAIRLASTGAKHVLIKGGHEEGTMEAVDLLYDGSGFITIASKRIVTVHTHGTGCTFSAAATAEMAKGKSVSEAVETAKAFTQAAIEDQLGIGGGHGPTNHWAYGRRTRGESQL
ncbi:MAG: phosphomethylpyrimidine kinase [Cohnella sp.]|nr:phosphomethylpyrimidine kinase [Cohnella sp.]